MNIADKATLDNINLLVNNIGNYQGYKNTTKSMRYYLPEGTRISCDRKEIQVLQAEGEPKLIDEGYEISSTGLVTLLTTEDNIEIVTYNLM